LRTTTSHSVHREHGLVAVVEDHKDAEVGRSIALRLLAPGLFYCADCLHFLLPIERRRQILLLNVAICLGLAPFAFLRGSRCGAIIDSAVSLPLSLAAFGLLPLWLWLATDLLPVRIQTILCTFRSKARSAMSFS